MSSSDSQVLGVVIVARHGDREGFYQNPSTYAAAATSITPLGNLQVFQLGQKIRSIYLNASSPSFISGFNTTLFDQSQFQARADAGGEGGVILNSAVSMLQGLFPATTVYNTTLANGTTVVAPLSGYQTIPIESVEPNNDISLEGFTSCGNFDKSTATFYNSDGFKAVAAEHADFLQQLPQYLDGRPVTLENMWNIFDFINVESIHSADFLRRLPPTFLAQARALANYHEYGVFSSPELGGIGNIAGRTMLPSILTGFKRISNSSDPLKMIYQSISYKPFISLFNMTGAAEANPQLAGVVNYAAALALEVRQPSGGREPVVRFTFKNGTDDNDFVTYNFMGGSGDVPLSTFVNTLSPVAISDTATWCDICGNTRDRGCGALFQAKQQGLLSAPHKFNPIGAGFLGAGLTLVVAAMLLALLSMVGWLSFGKGTKRRPSLTKSAEHESSEKASV